MTAEWTDRELEGIELLLRKLNVNLTEETAENLCVRCQERVIFSNPLGDFDELEWRLLGEKLGFLGFVSQGRDYAWDVNYGRLVPLLKQESVSIRIRRDFAKNLCDILSRHPSEIARGAAIVIKKSLGD